METGQSSTTIPATVETTVNEGGEGLSSLSQTPANQISQWTFTITQRYQHLLDKSVPHVRDRWIAVLVIGLIYAVRVLILQGFYIITYGLGIYMLNLLIGFLSPRIDPAFDSVNNDNDGPLLPTRESDEFRPFVRRLPEFKFWYSTMKAFCVAFLMTFFDAFDVPVFWPILLFYWVLLFILTMRRQIMHMIKYKYVPFTFGKQRYGKRPPSTDNISASQN